MSPRFLHPPRRRPSVEIVRYPEGPIEIKLSGLVGALEGRARRWRATVLILFIGLVVAVSVAGVFLSPRWDYQRARTLQVLRADLQVAQVRSRCWEALTRYLPESPKDVIADASRNEWVRQCVVIELTRLNPKR